MNSTEKEYTEASFLGHLQAEHRSTLFSDYLKEIVYGGNDGIVTTFAVVAGFAGAHSAAPVVGVGLTSVLLFGIANLFADGAAMGLGNFLSLRAEKNIYQRFKEKEWHEIHHNPDMEKKETVFLLQQRGFKAEDAQTLTEIMMKNKPYWLDFMMSEELGLSNPESIKPGLNGLATFLSFAVFGAVPILPYIIASHHENVFGLACLASLTSLILLGLLSGYVSGRQYVFTLFETILVGTVSGSIAFFVGTFFRAL